MFKYLINEILKLFNYLKNCGVCMLILISCDTVQCRYLELINVVYYFDIKYTHRHRQFCLCLKLLGKCQLLK